MITSADYVDQELRNEVGKLPPAFLPVKNKRLFEHQIKSLEFDEDIFISIPENYIIEEFDLQLLNDLKVEIIRIPINLSLADSISHALKIISSSDDNLRILHGDTLILDLPKVKKDFIIASTSDDDYDWALIYDYSKKLIYSGYFSLNDKVFFQTLLESNGNFIESLEQYSKINKLEVFESNCWLDFGHINTFFRSKAFMPNIRHFNSMVIDTNSVTKSSKLNNNKIIAESQWYENLPMELKYYTPQLVGVNNKIKDVNYKIEYLYLLTLNELFVYSNLSVKKWQTILLACKGFLNKASNFVPNSILSYINNDIYYKKTIQRLELFLSENKTFSSDLFYKGQNLGTLLFIVNETASFIPLPNENEITLVHGDFCLSNILFDFRKLDIKVIDPRGLNTENKPDIFGDNRYDLAKLAHSILGLYDFIIAERYTLFFHDNNFEIQFPSQSENMKIQELFLQIFSVNNKNIKELYASMIQLFISMLPLHKESKQRQMAIIANILRLYKKFIKL